MGITEIIRQGFANGDSYEVINKHLADGGFNLRLVPRENTGWADLEVKEGFKEGEPGVVFPALADMMKRNMKMAGMEEEIWCKEGKYKITWNEDGYATKAVRCNV